jgi:hypothetical protein
MHGIVILFGLYALRCRTYGTWIILITVNATEIPPIQGLYCCMINNFALNWMAMVTEADPDDSIFDIGEFMSNLMDGIGDILQSITEVLSD